MRNAPKASPKHHRRETRRFAVATVVVVAFAVAPASARIGSGVVHLPNRVRSVTDEGTVRVADLRHDATQRTPYDVTPAMPVPRVPVPRDVARRAMRDSAPASAMAAGEDAPGAPSVDVSFGGVGDNGFLPPDVAGAVGGSHVVTTLNGSFRVQSRAGAVLSDVTLAAFWSGITSTPFDPRVVYDPASARWFHVAVSDARSAASKMLIAASTTSDPTGTWHRYSMIADPAGVLWADYPTIGLNAGQVVYQTNMFRVDNGAFGTSIVEVFSKAALLAGGSPGAVETKLNGYGGTHQPSVAYGPSGPISLLQEVDGNSGGAGHLRLYEVDLVAASVSVGPWISVADPWGGSGNGRNDFAPQKGSTALLQTNDSRMGNVVYRNGKLFAAHTVFLPAAAPMRSAIQWWVLDASTGAVLQRGRVDDPTGTVFTAFPSVGVNADEDVLIGHARFSHAEYASAGYAFRYGADAPNTIRSGAVLKAGLAPYYRPVGTSPARNRWGDYSATVVDPVDDHALWTIQEYAALPAGGVDKWATWWGRIVPNPGPASAVAPSALSYGSQALGVASTVRTVTVTNAGSAPLAVGAIAITGSHASDFRATTDGCSATSLAPGAACTLGVVFTPPAQGSRSAALSIPSNSPTSPDVVSLSGMGYVEPPRISVDPGSLSFGGVAVGATSPAKAVTIRNVGSGSFSVNAVRVTGQSDFTASSSCGSLPAGASCSASVVFTPAAWGPRSATLEVDSSLGRSVVQLTGSGLDVVAPSSKITTADGSVAIGSLMPLRGTGADDLSGIDRVTVVYRPLLGSAETAIAALTCNGARTSCTWTVAAPIVPGVYAATATARDRAGNTESQGPSITIFVP